MTPHDQQAMPPTQVAPLDAEPLVTLDQQSAGATRDWRIWVACFGLWIAPAATVSVSPIMNSVAMDARSLNEAAIGMVRTLEILLNAGLTIWLSLRLGTLHPRPLGLLGLALLIAGNAGSTFGTDQASLILARLAAGAGAACVMSAGSALVAQIKSPQRLIGALAIPITAMGVISTLVAGSLAATQGQLGAFGVIALAALFGAPFVAFAPRRRAQTPQTAQVRPLFSSIGHPYVLASAACYFGGTAAWTFFARIARLHDMNEAQVSMLIAGVSVGAGVVVAIGAAVRDRWIAFGALAALTLYTVSYVVVPISPSLPYGATAFMIAFAGGSIAYGFIQNFFTVVGVRLDRTGGLNAAGNGWASLANAGAPWTAGVLITTTGSYAPIAIMALIAGAATFALMVVAMRNMPHA